VAKRTYVLFLNGFKMHYQKEITDDEYESEDSEPDVEAVDPEVKDAIGNDPTDEADNGGQMKNNEK